MIGCSGIDGSSSALVTRRTYCAVARMTNRPGGRLKLLTVLHQCFNMGRCGAAAAPDNLHTQVFHKVVKGHAHLHRGQPVMGHTPHVFRQARIGNATDHKRGLLAEVAHMGLHQIRAGGAIQPQDVDGEGLQNGDHRRCISTHQHGARGLHGDGDHHGKSATDSRHGLLQALETRLDLQHVLAGLQQQQVHPPIH